MLKRKTAVITTPMTPGVYTSTNTQTEGKRTVGPYSGGRDNLTFESDISDVASIQVLDNCAELHTDVGNRDTERHGTQDDTKLKKSINLIHCTAIMVAVTGHSSIFISPAAILRATGSIGASLVIWLTGGLINLGLALCFTELGTMIPHAGGPYAYVSNTFGPLPGFLIMWGYVVLIAGPFWAFLAYTAALYIVKLVFPDCHEDRVETAVRLLAGWIMITFVALNCVYMKYVTKIQTFLSSTKLIALLIIIIAGIYQLAVGNVENFENMFEGTTQEPGQHAVAIFYSIFSYGGWQVMTSLMEEVKNPGRDLPVSVYLTFTVVIIKYILTNVAYYTLLTPQEVLQSDAVALLFIRRLYEPVTAVIAVFVATTSIGALNASIMGHSRLLFAGARKGHMPMILGMIHPKYLTPWPAIFTLLVWGLAMLYSGTVTDMMEFISLFSTIMGVAVILSLLYLRVKKPDTDRPYQTLLFVPVTQLLINMAVLVLAIYQKPHRMGVGLGILFLGIPVYWFGVLWQNKPSALTDLVGYVTAVTQKILLLVKTE